MFFHNSLHRRPSAANCDFILLYNIISLYQTHHISNSPPAAHKEGWRSPSTMRAGGAQGLSYPDMASKKLQKKRHLEAAGGHPLNRSISRGSWVAAGSCRACADFYAAGGLFARYPAFFSTGAVGHGNTTASTSVSPHGPPTGIRWSRGLPPCAEHPFPAAPEDSTPSRGNLSGCLAVRCARRAFTMIGDSGGATCRRGVVMTRDRGTSCPTSRS
jgi:hypothetical protein